VKYYLRLLSIPLSFLVLFSSLHILWEVFGLPSPEELTTLAQSWFDTYGLPAVFVSAIIEGMLLVGGYWPGVFIIFLGIVLSDSIAEAVITVMVITLGLFVAHLANYALGRYGWYKLLVRFGLKNAIEDARERLVRRGPVVILSMYWLPSVAALTDTAAGIIHMPFRKFFLYSLISVVGWDVVIGVFVYVFKDLALTIAGPGTSGMLFIYGVIVVWMLVLLAVDLYGKKKSSVTSQLPKQLP